MLLRSSIFTRWTNNPVNLDCILFPLLSLHSAGSCISWSKRGEGSEFGGDIVALGRGCVVRAKLWSENFFFTMIWIFFKKTCHICIVIIAIFVIMVMTNVVINYTKMYSVHALQLWECQGKMVRKERVMYIPGKFCFVSVYSDFMLPFPPSVQTTLALASLCSSWTVYIFHSTDLCLFFESLVVLVLDPSLLCFLCHCSLSWEIPWSEELIDLLLVDWWVDKLR